MKNINVAIFGANPYNGNRGVGALAYSTLFLIDKVCEENNIKITYYLIHEEQGITNRDDEISIGKRVFKFTNTFRFDITRIRSFVKFLVTPSQWESFIDYFKFDLILNIGGGDSFSDIYGTKRFKTINGQNKLARLFRKKYVILPQTVGPFTDAKVKKEAFRSLKKSFAVFARDEVSFNYAINNDKQLNLFKSLDLAFFMPFEKKSFTKDYVNVGINVSSLLWNGGYTGDNQFGLKVEYPDLIRQIIAYFLSIDNVKLYLIPHVVHDYYHIENDYAVCQKLEEEYSTGKIILSPFFLTPIQAKNYISGMDFFLGARMHSTIAAFSSGVPVFPMAYSRKFNGLFCNTLKYNFIGDMVNDNEEDILNSLKLTFDNREDLKNVIDERIKTIIKDRKNLFEKQLLSLFESIS